MQVRTSIRKLVEFVCRSGSIDSRFTGTDRALLGGKIHRRIQKMSGRNYRREKTLSLKIDFEGIEYELYGRADGIINDGEKLTIDEIKTVSVPLEDIDEDYSRAHWAQGCIYRYIICAQSHSRQSYVQLTYYNIDTDEIKRHVKLFSFNQLEEILFHTLREYKKWAQMSRRWQEKRNMSMKNIAFPFSSYRPGQRELAVACYKVIRDRQRLFACAPTGIGKTASTLFPALKATGENMIDKVFCLTAKNSNANAVSDTLEYIKNANSEFYLRYINITAKDKMCFLDERKCDPLSCPYANGYYDRVREKLFDIVTQSDCFTAEKIRDIAGKFVLCPYELSLDISEWCDLVICDYNYLFDPTVRLARFFEGKKSDYVFLVDEAHNLPDRAREMYSARLDKRSFYDVKKKLGKRDKKLNKSLNDVNRFFLSVRQQLEKRPDRHIISDSFPREITGVLKGFLARASAYFDRHKSETADDDMLKLYFDAKFFDRIIQLYDDSYRTVLSLYRDNIHIKLYCADPSANISRRFDSGRAAVCFSATLEPLEYYRRLIGGKGEMIRVPSPFPRENLGLFIADKISAKYADRARSMPQVCDMIHTMTSAKTGNYIAYFPSYEYMSAAFSFYRSIYQKENCICQQKDMDEKRRGEFLAEFDKKNQDGLLAFCVMGGIYGEGIDLAGESLIGCAVVSVGLAQINVYTDILRDYHNRSGEDGFSYAYQYPGMNKVMQAAGRVIRSETDRGVVLLIDSRFNTPRYRKNMPPHWRHATAVKNTAELESYLTQFWNNGRKRQIPSEIYDK